MKRLLSAVTICSLALGLSGAPALAQQHAGPDFKAQLIRSSNLIGADIHNTAGEEIGQINDIVFDENTGKMMHPVLAAGGFLGIGDKLTPVTWDSIEVKKNEKEDGLKVVTTLDKAKLTAEKSSDKASWSGTDKTWMQQLPGTTGKKLVRMSEVDDAKLFDKTGQHIGKIEEVVVDTRSGKVAYAVISFEDEFIKQGDKMTMVPWNLVRQSEKDTPGFVLHADKAKLEGATFFEPNKWPDMQDITWNKQVYDHYAVSPYYWTGV